MNVAAGEVEDKAPDDGKDRAAWSLGKEGGLAGEKSLTPEERKATAKEATKSRWKKPLDLAVNKFYHPVWLEILTGERNGIGRSGNF